MSLIAYPCVMPSNQHLLNNIDYDVEVIIISCLNDIRSEITPFTNLPIGLKFLVLDSELKYPSNGRDYNFYFPKIPFGCEILFLDSCRQTLSGKTRGEYHTYSMKKHINTPFYNYILYNHIGQRKKIKNLSGNNWASLKCYFNHTMTKFEFIVQEPLYKH